MNAETFERRATLAFAIATYVHVTRDSPMLWIGIAACLIYPWMMQVIYGRPGAGIKP